MVVGIDYFLCLALLRGTVIYNWKWSRHKDEARDHELFNAVFLGHSYELKNPNFHEKAKVLKHLNKKIRSF